GSLGRSKSPLPSTINTSGSETRLAPTRAVNCLLRSLRYTVVTRSASTINRAASQVSSSSYLCGALLLRSCRASRRARSSSSKDGAAVKGDLQSCGASCAHVPDGGERSTGRGGAARSPSTGRGAPRCGRRCGRDLGGPLDERGSANGAIARVRGVGERVEHRVADLLGPAYREHAFR